MSASQLSIQDSIVLHKSSGMAFYHGSNLQQFSIFVRRAYTSRQTRRKAKMLSESTSFK